MQNTCNYIADVFGLPRHAVGNFKVEVTVCSQPIVNGFAHSTQTADLTFNVLMDASIERACRNLMYRMSNGSFVVNEVANSSGPGACHELSVKVAALQGEETTKLFKIMASDFGA